LLLVAVFEDTLNDPATIWMGGQVIHLTIKCLHNELNKMRRHLFDAFLDDMVAVLVFNAFHDVAIEFFNHLSLLLNIYDLQCLKTGVISVSRKKKKKKKNLVPSVSLYSHTFA